MPLISLLLRFINKRINLCKLNVIFIFSIIFTISTQGSCLICSENNEDSNYFDHESELVTTACSYVFHLSCITKLFNEIRDSDGIFLTACCPHPNCNEIVVPLIRELGVNFSKVPRYCETEAMNACRLGNL